MRGQNKLINQQLAGIR